MRIWLLTAALLLALAPAALCAQGSGGLLTQDTGVDAARARPQLARIGLVPLADESKIRGGGEELDSILLARLEDHFEDVEFVAVDPGVIGIKNGAPLLLEDAAELGVHYGVDALLTGTFIGVDIVGGTWPNHGADFPSAQGWLRWRLVGCAQGLLLADGTVDFGKPRIYSQRVKDTAQLRRRVMQDLADEALEQLEGIGELAGTARPADDEDSMEGDGGG